MKNDPRIEHRYGRLWYLCCEILWSPKNYQLADGQSGHPDHCTVCGVFFPSQFMIEALKLDMEIAKKETP